MANEKVYTPETISENSLPLEDSIVSLEVSESGSENSGYSQGSIQNQPVPTKKVATELLSSVLNTKTRKIIGEFQFTPSGAIKIGNYQEGESGEIRITPDGILGLDVYGNTTFAIDSSDGSAVFKGEIRADDFVISDNNGILSLSNFRNGTVSAASEQLITSTSFTDLDSMSLVTPEFSRPVVALILFTCQQRVIPSSGSSYSASVNFSLFIDGVEIPQTYMTKYAEGDPAISWAHDGQAWLTTTCHFLEDLSAGSHLLKIRWKMIQYTGTGKGAAYARSLSFAVLGS